MSDAIIVNKVAESGIKTIDLAPFIPNENSLAFFDLKPLLFMELILKEKDFRASLKTLDWSIYEGKHIAIGCSVDAIIPAWAYVLVATYLKDIALSVVFGDLHFLKNYIIESNINNLNIEDYRDDRVVLKGCGDKEVPNSAYVAAAHKLLPVVKSLMYGEPCSTVPLYKKK